MRTDTLLVRALPGGLALLLLAACATREAPPPRREPARATEPAPPMTPRAESSPPAPPPPALPPSPAAALEAAVAYADRLRALSAPDLAQEVQRLGDNGYTPLRATQLALALGQSRGAANTTRAQALLQRVLADSTADAQALHPYARVAAAQIAEQRRAEEQAERQAQQLRDAQRRIDQLNDRLEAVRAIERSLPGPGRSAAPRP